MDNATVAWVVGGLVTILGSVLFALFQRQLQDSKDREKERNDQIDKALLEHRTKEGELTSKLQQLELAMAHKIGREELKAEFNGVYEKMDTLSNTVISALGAALGQHKEGKI